jgi:acyl carrier protein
MTDEEIKEKVFDIFAKEARLDRESLTAESVHEELNIESLDMVQILFGIEETFDVYVPQEEVENLKTMGDVINGIKVLLADAAA